MKQYAVVYVDEGLSYLCKWYGDHYEVVAQHKSSNSLKDLATVLNEMHVIEIVDGEE